MLHLGHRDSLKNLGLGVFHLSDYFAGNEQHNEQYEERSGHQQKSQARIVRGLIDHHTRDFSYVLYSTPD
jgi:hypothetical protein